MNPIYRTAALAAVLFAAACGKPGQDSPSPPSGDPQDDLVLAEVGDRQILLRDLLHKIDVQIPAAAEITGVQEVRQKRQILDQMLDQYCWVILAEENGWDRDAEFLAVLELSRKYILANHSAEKAVYSQAQPTADEIETYYRENADEFRLPRTCKASQIVVATEEEAREIGRQLRAGADFAELARERSIDRTARSGGLLGTVLEGTDVKGHPNRADLASLILGLGEGAISDPVRVDSGWAIFWTYEHAPERPRPLDEVADLVRDMLFKKKSNELFSETLARVRRDASSQVQERNFVAYAVTRLSDVEIQAMGTAEADPELKIAYFQGLLEQHPTSPIVPQAQFMIGFIKADELKDYSGARAAFETMIQLYPDDDLAESARWMLANMEKDVQGDPQLEQIRFKAREKRKSK